MHAVRAINALAAGRPDNTATADAGAKIVDCGQLRRGKPFVDVDHVVSAVKPAAASLSR